MAQPIHCDWTGHLDALADVMVTNMANGDTSAWCFPHYVEVCRATVETFDQGVAEAEAAEVAQRLEGVTPPPDAEPGSSAGDGEAEAEPSTDEPEGAAPEAAPGDSEATEPAAAPPDLGVGTFRAAGDEPVQEALGGPETGPAAEAGPEPAAELSESARS